MTTQDFLDMSHLFDLSPLARLMLVGVLLALPPLAWVGLRQRRAGPSQRLQTLALVTLFLTFDLVLFGAFTRLTDSGLGCPDWPGCYGSATPLGAQTQISLAQTALPSGPVTHTKAWIEMIHRYLASGVGVLIVVMTCLSWWGSKPRGSAPAVRPFSPWWPTLTLLWVCMQGAFGALTVTMKLFPAIVSLHLLGGYGLLALLTIQVVKGRGHEHQPFQGGGPVNVLHGVRFWIAACLALLVLQAASGAWVSTNYAVLACSEFPMCQGSWWPDMDFAGGFELWRALGLSGQGQSITFQALTAIHMTHRMLAVVTLLALGSLAAYLWASTSLNGYAKALAALLLLQFITGVSNAVLGWPLLAAVLHTGGAGAMVVVLTGLLTATRGYSPQQRPLAFVRRSKA
jgi:cytochrome c oxidase assembly protein subunit 15